MIKVIEVREQATNSLLNREDTDAVISCLEDEEIAISVKRGKNDENCLTLNMNGNELCVNTSYFVGVDWLKNGEIAVRVNPKMNSGFEIDYVKMLNNALCETDNYNCLDDLVTIEFNKQPIPISQNQDLLSIFLISEYIFILRKLVRKGLKRNFYFVEQNIKNKVKGKILVARNIRQNLGIGRVTNNVCKYQVYDIDSTENRILKKALRFCNRQIKIYNHDAFDISVLEKNIRYIYPFFENVNDTVSTNEILTYQGNPLFKDYNEATRLAKLLLKRFSYNITIAGQLQVSTPPFWIDMSKLFELYVLHQLRQAFSKKGEVIYHPHFHYQELDYLLKPTHWTEPYVIDAKYKPWYKDSKGMIKEDAREVAGYARLSGVYKELGLNEESTPPIKCLIIYPDQECDEHFDISKELEKVQGYIRMYKTGIRLPVIKN